MYEPPKKQLFIFRKRKKRIGTGFKVPEISIFTVTLLLELQNISVAPVLL